MAANVLVRSALAVDPLALRTVPPAARESVFEQLDAGGDVNLLHRLSLAIRNVANVHRQRVRDLLVAVTRGGQSQNPFVIRIERSCWSIVF